MSANAIFLYLISSIGFSLITLLVCFVLVLRQSKKIARLSLLTGKLKQEIQVSNKCAIGMGKTLTALQHSKAIDLRSSKESTYVASNESERNDCKNRVGQAQNLCKEGASSAQMISQLGLTKVEAELISAMNQPASLSL